MRDSPWSLGSTKFGAWLGIGASINPGWIYLPWSEDGIWDVVLYPINGRTRILNPYYIGIYWASILLGGIVARCSSM